MPMTFHVSHSLATPAFVRKGHTWKKVQSYASTLISTEGKRIIVVWELNDLSTHARHAAWLMPPASLADKCQNHWNLQMKIGVANQHVPNCMPCSCAASTWGSRWRVPPSNRKWLSLKFWDSIFPVSCRCNRVLVIGQICHVILICISPLDMYVQMNLNFSFWSDEFDQIVPISDSHHQRVNVLVCNSRALRKAYNVRVLQLKNMSRMRVLIEIQSKSRLINFGDWLSAER